MKRPIALIAAAVTAAVPVTAVGKPKRKHVPGCNTPGCDDRIGARWAARHPKARMALAVASWYGPGLYGHRTACGQTLGVGTEGVAHRSLPCGTRLRLCLARCTTTRVIDRGPYVGGRTFDLTAPVKAAIGMSGGVATVRFAVG